MSEPINRLDADYRLFRKIWKRLHDHALSKLENKDDNEFRIKIDVNGKETWFDIVLSDRVNGWHEPLKKIRYFRKPAKHWKFLVFTDEQWADVPPSYDRVGETVPMYPYSLYYMNWEEMFIIVAKREEILKALLEEIERRNEKERINKNPFQSLSEKLNLSIEGADRWLSNLDG